MHDIVGEGLSKWHMQNMGQLHAQDTKVHTYAQHRNCESG